VIGSHDLSARTVGVAGGLDYHLTPDTVVGIALAGGGTNWSLSQGLGGGKSDAFQAGLYGATRWGPAYLAAAFAFANHWMSTDRVAVGDHLTADFNAQSYGGRLEGGYRFGMPYGGITPYAAIQAQSFHTPGFTETDAIANGFGLAFGSRDATDTRSELGARLGERCHARAGVPGASRRELHRQRRHARKEFRAHVRRHGASPRQRRHAACQVRRRVRLPLIDLRGDGHDPLQVVASQG